ncbi:MAG: MFS transporter [Asticcacaulis sp.]
MNAAFGVGFVLGPAWADCCAGFPLNWPFAAAAVLVAVNLALTVFVLPETRKARAEEKVDVNPLAPLRAIGAFRALAALLAVSALFAVIGEIGGSVWVLYVEGKFHWHGITVGLSLALFGLFHALVQAFLVGPVTARLGERGALLVAMAADTVSYVTIALISDGMIALALTPLLCLGGMGASVLTAVISKKADDAHQGALQGVLSSLGSLAAIIAPVGFLSLYFATRSVFPGLVWIVGAGLYALCLPVVLNRKTYA